MKRISAVVMALICSMTILFTGPAMATESAISPNLDPGIIGAIISASIASATSVGTTIGSELSNLTGKHMAVGIINATPVDLTIEDSKYYHGYFNRAPVSHIDSPLEVLAGDLVSGDIPDVKDAPLPGSDSYVITPKGNSGMGAVVLYKFTKEDIIKSESEALAKKLDEFAGKKLAIYSRKSPAGRLWLGVAVGRDNSKDMDVDKIYKEFDKKRNKSKEYQSFHIGDLSACLSANQLCSLEDGGIEIKAPPAKNTVLDVRVDERQWPKNEIADLYREPDSSQ